MFIVLNTILFILLSILGIVATIASLAVFGFMIAIYKMSKDQENDLLEGQ